MTSAEKSMPASFEEAIASAKKMILTKRKKGYSTLFEEGFE